MNSQTSSFLPIGVCTGAGCKAWGSVELINNLNNSSNHNNGARAAFPIKCLQSCGGGVNVKISLIRKPIKIRETGKICEIRDLIFSRTTDKCA